LGGNVFLRLNKARAPGFDWIETEFENWRYDPSDPCTDVAVYPLDSDELASLAQFDFLDLPLSMGITDEQMRHHTIGLGDEIFVIGLFFRHYGEQRNVPIVRIGNIAAMPEEPMWTRVGDDTGRADAYLVEARSTQGLSGSPVFVHLGPTRGSAEGMSMGSDRFYLMGLMHGHWDAPPSELEPAGDAWDVEAERLNVGIAQVVPFRKIVDVLNQTDLFQQRQIHLARHIADRAATPDEEITQ
jgi:hypothetical protein